MRYFLGIDAGGTKTTAVLADAQTVLTRAHSGSIKVTRTGADAARQNLAAIFSDLERQSGVSAQSIASTCIGLSGVTVPEIADWARAELCKHLQGTVHLCGDEEIALDAAFHGGPGVLVIAGTGSNVVGRLPHGEIFHLGGWGPVLSDEGSGYWIGLQAVRATLQALDRGEPTKLYAEILRCWKIGSHTEIVEVGNRVPGPDFSQLARGVSTCAEQGDAVALRVLQEGGSLLGTMATFALHRLKSAGSPAGGPLHLAFTGSVAAHVAPLREALIATVHASFPEVTVHPKPVDAALGAVWRAQQAVSTH